ASKGYQFFCSAKQFCLLLLSRVPSNLAGGRTVIRLLRRRDRATPACKLRANPLQLPLPISTPNAELRVAAFFAASLLSNLLGDFIGLCLSLSKRPSGSSA